MKADTILVFALGVLVLSFCLFGLACDDATSTGDDDSATEPTPAGDDDVSPVDDDDDSSPPDAAVFRAGFAQEDITPKVSTPLAGFGMEFFSADNLRWSTGTHDPLYAQAAAFEDADGQALILIATDLVGLIANEVKQIQAGLATELAIEPERVIVAATHNHHGPDTIGLWGVILPPISGRNEDVMAMIVKKSIAAGVRAWEAREPATLTVAAGDEPRMHFNKHQRGDPQALIDNTLSVLFAWNQAGEMLGSLMNWPCHVTEMIPENTLYSADFAGAYYRAMQEGAGGIHLFFNGALGANIQPLSLDDPWHDWVFNDRDWSDVEAMGDQLAADVFTLADRAAPVSDPKIQILAATEYEVANENFLFWAASNAGLTPRDIPPPGGVSKSTVTIVSIGKVMLGTLPGEWAPDYAFELRELMGGRVQFLIGLGMDWIGYALTEREYDNFTYLYDRSLAPSRETGEELLAVYRAVFAR